MKVLWVATKIPWPPVDGGRLLLRNTLRALVAEGCEVTLVAPTLGAGKEAVERASAALAPHARLYPVAARLRPRALDLMLAQLTGWPWTAVRHALPAVRRAVAERLAAERFDVVQAEQVQALGALAERPAGTPPVVWRAQNVESDLWAQTARELGWRRPLFAREARRLARREAAAVAETAATLALTREDASRLAELSGEPEKIHHLPAPFEAELPAAVAPLPGDPAFVLFGSGGWLPNRRGADWMVREVWPLLREKAPGARLHLFGEAPSETAPGLVRHPPPDDSRDAYAPRSVLAVPLAIASGVRMKILEAWSRGVPVVATSAAARGLGAHDGREILVADDASDFARALADLAAHPGRAADLVAAGRELLRRQHDPAVLAGRLMEIYSAQV